MPTTPLVQFRKILKNPPIDSAVIHLQAPLLHHLFQVTIAEGIAAIPPDIEQDDISLIMTLFEQVSSLHGRRRKGTEPLNVPLTFDKHTIVATLPSNRLPLASSIFWGKQRQPSSGLPLLKRHHSLDTESLDVTLRHRWYHSIARRYRDDLLDRHFYAYFYSVDFWSVSQSHIPRVVYCCCRLSLAKRFSRYPIRSTRLLSRATAASSS